MSEPLVVVGNGMAAARFCEDLVERACGRYAIAVVGEEPRLAYNRVLLSSLLAEEISAADVELKPARWWRDGPLRSPGDHDRSRNPARAPRQWGEHSVFETRHRHRLAPDPPFRSGNGSAGREGVSRFWRCHRSTTRRQRRARRRHRR